MMYVILTSLLIVFLLFAGAFFSMTETAFTSLSRITVRQMQKNREKHSELIAALKAEQLLYCIEQGAYLSDNKRKHYD